MTASSRLRKPQHPCKVPKTVEQLLNVPPSTSSPSKKDIPPSQIQSSPNLSKLTDDDEDDADEVSFEDHSRMTRRMAKRLYYGRKLPVNPRPSLPLTVLAVNAFTSGTFDSNVNTLEFLDLDMASEVGRNACVSPTTLIMALVYLDRLSRNNLSYLKGGSVSPSELFVVALLVANKFTQEEGEDCGVFNDEWAASARMELKRLNGLELQFLNAMDWNLKVDESEYMKYLEAVERKLAQSEGSSRGWFTYTELDSLTMQNKETEKFWNGALEHIIKVTAATYIAYATFIATLITSSVLLPQFIAITKGCIKSTGSTSPGNWNHENFTASNILDYSSLHTFFQMDETDSDSLEFFEEGNFNTLPNESAARKWNRLPHTQKNHHQETIDLTCQLEKTNKLIPGLTHLLPNFEKCWSEFHEDLRRAQNGRTVGNERLKHYMDNFLK